MRGKFHVPGSRTVPTVDGTPGLYLASPIGDLYAINTTPHKLSGTRTSGRTSAGAASCPALRMPRPGPGAAPPAAHMPRQLHPPPGPSTGAKAGPPVARPCAAEGRQGAPAAPAPACRRGASSRTPDLRDLLIVAPADAGTTRRRLDKRTRRIDNGSRQSLSAASVTSARPW